MGEDKMKIAVTGATGFIGHRLCQYLRDQGYYIEPIGRELLGNMYALQAIVADCDAVINLAGAPINHRWNREYKQKLYDSRIITTRKIVEAINNTSKCRVLISASAIGYYPSTGCYDEYSKNRGNDFLADLCQKWEEQAQMVKPSVRLIIARFGLVLSKDGGALKKLMLGQKFGVTAILAKGDYPFSWIASEDLMRAIEFILKHEMIHGTVNCTVPDALTMRQFMIQLAQYNNSILVISIPKFILQLMYGEVATFFTNGQCVYPKKLMDNGFRFCAPHVSDLL